jgi:hypothetical protein
LFTWSALRRVDTEERASVVGARRNRAANLHPRRIGILCLGTYAATRATSCAPIARRDTEPWHGHPKRDPAHSDFRCHQPSPRSRVGLAWCERGLLGQRPVAVRARGSVWDRAEGLLAISHTRPEARPPGRIVRVPHGGLAPGAGARALASWRVAAIDAARPFELRNVRSALAQPARSTVVGLIGTIRGPERTVSLGASFVIARCFRQTGVIS